MGLNENRKHIPSTYTHDDPIFEEYNNKYCKNPDSPEKVRWENSLQKAAQRPKTMAAKIAFSSTDQDLTELLKNSPKLTDKESVNERRNESENIIIGSKSNYLLTISMKPNFSKNWKSYNRDYYTAQLFQKTAVLLKKLFFHFDERLAKTPYEKWPFFFGTMEHVNEEGVLVAPHGHILFRHQAGIDVLRSVIRQLWSEAMGHVGPSDIDLQHVTTENLAKRAAYILKSSFRDGLDLQENVDKVRLCQINGWSEQALAHDMWMINRETFRNALKNNRHDLLDKNFSEPRITERKKQFEAYCDIIKILQ